MTDNNDGSSTYTNADAALDILIGLAFCLGVVGSAIPQHINCWKARSAEGFSLMTLLIATVCLTCRLVAALLEDSDNIAAAQGFLPSVAAAMPVIQVALMILFTTPSYILYYFLWYKPPPPSSSNVEMMMDTAACELVDSSPEKETHEKRVVLPVDDDDDSQQMSVQQYKRKDLTFTLGTVALALTIVMITIFGLIAPKAFHKSFQIKFWGALAAILNAVLWLPQVVKTYRLKSGGVLSVTMLSINSFGDLVLVGYWIKLRQSFWIWSSPVSDALMQILLIVMIVHYRRTGSGGGVGMMRRSRSYMEERLVSEKGDEFVDNPNVDEDDGVQVRNYMSMGKHLE